MDVRLEACADVQACQKLCLVAHASGARSKRSAWTDLERRVIADAGQVCRNRDDLVANEQEDLLGILRGDHGIGAGGEVIGASSGCLPHGGPDAERRLECSGVHLCPGVVANRRAGVVDPFRLWIAALAGRHEECSGRAEQELASAENLRVL